MLASRLLEVPQFTGSLLVCCDGRINKTFGLLQRLGRVVGSVAKFTF